MFSEVQMRQEFAHFCHHVISSLKEYCYVSVTDIRCRQINDLTGDKICICGALKPSSLVEVYAYMYV